MKQCIVLNSLFKRVISGSKFERLNVLSGSFVFLPTRRAGVAKMASTLLSNKVYLQVLGTASSDTTSSLLIFTDSQRYLFNCGEGTQRIFNEQKIKYNKLNNIFFTQISWDRIGGLPGMAMTLRDNGKPSLGIYGPAGIKDFVNATRFFLFHERIQFNCIEYAEEKGEEYVDSNLTITPVVLQGNQTDNTTTLPTNPEEPQTCEDDSERGHSPKKKIKLDMFSNDKTIVCYICKLVEVPGKFLLQKAKELGVPKGPLYGKLKNGEVIVLADGTKIHPEQVTEPTKPGPVLMIIDCPSLDYLPSLVSSTLLAAYHEGAVQGIVPPYVIVHLAPMEIYNNPLYQSWRERFGAKTEHLLINRDVCNNQLVFSRQAMIQCKLHTLDHRIFPLIHHSTTPPMSAARLPIKTTPGEFCLQYHFRPTKQQGYDRSNVPEPLDVKGIMHEARTAVASARDGRSNVPEPVHIQDFMKEATTAVAVARDGRSNVPEPLDVQGIMNGARNAVASARDGRSNVPEPLDVQGCMKDARTAVFDAENIGNSIHTIDLDGVYEIFASDEDGNKTRGKHEKFTMQAVEKNYKTSKSSETKSEEGNDCVAKEGRKTGVKGMDATQNATGKPAGMLNLVSAQKDTARTDTLILEEKDSLTTSNNFDIRLDVHPKCEAITRTSPLDTEPNCSSEVDTNTVFKSRGYRLDLQSIVPAMEISTIDTGLSSNVQGDGAAKSEGNICIASLANVSNCDEVGSDFEVVFIGTGASLPSKYRNVSSTLLHISDRVAILLDCGEGTLGQLYRHYGNHTDDVIGRITCVFISHMHADHHLGLPSVLLRKAELANSRVSLSTLVIGPEKMRLWLQEYSSLCQRLQFRFMDCASFSSDFSEPSFLASLEAKEVSVVPVDHCPSAYGLVLSHVTGWKVVYSGDTRPCDRLVTAGSGATLLIHEATFEDELNSEAIAKKHSTTTEAITSGLGMRARFIMLNHFSQRYPKIPVFSEKFTKHTGIAFDHMTVRPKDFSKIASLLSPLKILFAEEMEELTLNTETRRSKQKEKNIQ